QRHVSQYKNYKDNKKGSKLSVYDQFDTYGVTNFKILQIKSYEVCQEHNKDRRHLAVYEQLWINRIRCINKTNPFNIYDVT
ncbi:hypothetical protein ACLJB6_09410, partial [Campylobacter coli]|uniref:hypothetical protein n=1 Tax=Campylobacter coli TaxID=195 RepID=UPI003F7C137D